MRAFALALLLLSSPAFGQPSCPATDADATGRLATDLAAVPGVATTTAPDGYTRNTVSVTTPRTLEEAARAGTVLPVPYRVQEGPTCGLYALGMVMDYFHESDARNASPYVLAGDATRRDAANFRPTTEKRLFETARDNGYFAESLRIVGKEGGMFVADELGQLATKFGYAYKRHDDATATTIVRSIDRGHPALVGFDVNRDGNPSLENGKRAHWAVVVGYFQYEGEQYFVAQHGWERKRYLWKASDLEASMRQIQPTLGPKVIEVFPSHR